MRNTHKSIRKFTARLAVRRRGKGRRPHQSAKRDRVAGNKKIGVVDLFCGAGGLTKGLVDAGVPVRLGIDSDAACQYPYEANNPNAKFLLHDVAKLKCKVLLNAWKGVDVRVLAGCAPCQPFSSYTQGRNWKHSDQWSLLRTFAKLVKGSKPDIVTMENVSSLAHHRVFRNFCDCLIDQGFEIAWDVLDCRNFGIPQSRRRLVLIASRLGKPQLPRPTHANPKRWKTVRQTIGKLPPIQAGSSDPTDPLHVSSRLTLINLQRLRASKPGGTWRDWPDELVAKCHRRKGGKRYRGVYGRMRWNAPSPTITGQCYGFGNGRFGHPSQARGISLREAALLQSFSTRYSFVPPDSRVSIMNVGQLIGNAVPPRQGGGKRRRPITFGLAFSSRGHQPARRLATNFSSAFDFVRRIAIPKMNEFTV
jgi:DNA (cytosine-5)-methyltransferase 1